MNENDARCTAIAAAQRELAQMIRLDKAAAGLLWERDSSAPRRTVVFSVRLDSAEVSLLEQRAEQLELKPSVLARNFIRIGLRAGGAAGVDEGIAAAVRRLLGVAEELRSLVA